MASVGLLDTSREGEDAGMSVSEEKEEEYQRLVEQFRAAGADDPETWARSEIGENIAQLARFCFLRSLWPRQIDRWRDDFEWVDRFISAAQQHPTGFFADAGLAMERLLALGGTREELASIARMVAYSTAFEVVHHIDEGCDAEFNEEQRYPTWNLIEVGPDDQPTGRLVDGLHEDLLMMDPSGREGRPQ
jgi:hypothetical protein